MPTITFFGYYVSQDVTQGEKKSKKIIIKSSVATTYIMCKFTTAAECWIDFFFFYKLLQKSGSLESLNLVTSKKGSCRWLHRWTQSAISNLTNLNEFKIMCSFIGWPHH